MCGYASHSNSASLFTSRATSVLNVGVRVVFRRLAYLFSFSKRLVVISSREFSGYRSWV